MGTTYSRSYSPAFVYGAGLAGTNVEVIHGRVYALNESVQRQLEEADKWYMELQEWHEREKEHLNQQLQSMEQRMTTMYTYF